MDKFNLFEIFESFSSSILQVNMVKMCKRVKEVLQNTKKKYEATHQGMGSAQGRRRCHK
jgi:hypothetical protein